MGQEITQWLMYRHSWSVVGVCVFFFLIYIYIYIYIRTCHCDLSVAFIKLFSGIKKTSSLVTTLLNIQIIWISDLLGVR